MESAKVDCYRAARTPSRGEMSYSAGPSLSVLRPIAEDAETAALHEFHNNRRLFRLDGGLPMTFTEFAVRLCHGEVAHCVFGNQTELEDIAYDDLVRRFTDVHRSGTHVRKKRRVRDCRKNFASIVRAVDRWRERHGGADSLELEAATARICQRKVATHAWFALLEALRNHNPTRSRYQGRSDGRLVTVWMPKWLTGRRRREWLRRHAGVESDATDSALQRHADREFGRCSVRPISEAESLADACQPSPLDWLIEHEIATRGLVAFVADEKADRIAELPPSIAALGPDRVRVLVHRIFHAKEGGFVCDRTIAAEFGLSPASYSRLAGSRWRPGGPRSMPVLIDNLCQVLAAHPPFTDAARRAGVWETVRQLLERQGSNAHE